MRTDDRTDGARRSIQINYSTFVDSRRVHVFILQYICTSIRSISYHTPPHRVHAVFIEHGAMEKEYYIVYLMYSLLIDIMSSSPRRLSSDGGGVDRTYLYLHGVHKYTHRLWTATRSSVCSCHVYVCPCVPSCARQSWMDGRSLYYVPVLRPCTTSLYVKDDVLDLYIHAE